MKDLEEIGSVGSRCHFSPIVPTG